MIEVIGITDVLLARIVSGRTCFSISVNSFLLEWQILQHGLDDIVGVAHRGSQIGDRCHPLDRFGIVAEIIQVGEDARLGAVEACLGLIRDGDLVPGQREILRDAVAHQAGADYRDFCFSHSALSVPVLDAVQQEMVHR